MRKKYYQYQEDVLDPAIPLSFFRKFENLTPAQALSIFLHDELNLDFTDAGAIVGRNEATIRNTYSVAIGKIKNKTKRRSPYRKPATEQAEKNEADTAKRPQEPEDLPEL